MNNIPSKVHGEYDFLWSNCALGHLGSIKKGLDFIETSLHCLKPGGWAVHTTEINVISNDQTVDSGATVIFRLKDIYGLCQRLTEQGFICSPFSLSNGPHTLDQAVSLNPLWGTDRTKILVGGHIATQAFLLFHLPEKPLARHQKLREKMRHKRVYKKNLAALQKINASNVDIKLLKGTQQLALPGYRLTPLKQRLKADRSKDKVMVQYRNDSTHILTGIDSLFDAKPLVLGTDNPVNHPSPLANNKWFAPNRPCVRLHKATSSGWQEVDYIKPGEVFGYCISLDPTKKAKAYSEDFSIIQEGGGIVPATQVTINVA
jgi:hypothetical protein